MRRARRRRRCAALLLRKNKTHKKTTAAHSLTRSLHAMGGACIDSRCRVSAHCGRVDLCRSVLWRPPSMTTSVACS